MDPADRELHTNTVEACWRPAKAHLKAMHGVNRNHLSGYLDEFLWRRNFTQSRVDAAEQLIDEIARQFPAMRPQQHAEVIQVEAEVEVDEDIVTVVGDGCYKGPLPLYADEEEELQVDFDSFLVDEEPIEEQRGKYKCINCIIMVKAYYYEFF